MKRLVIVIMLLAAPLCAQQRASILGIHLRATKAQVHARLKGKARFIREDENQEVWKPERDSDLRDIFVGYDAENRVRYVTVLANDNSVGLKCEPLGEIAKAQKSGDVGNWTFTRALAPHDSNEIAIAKGTREDHLNLCGLKRVGVGGEDEEQEHRERDSKKKPE